MTITDEAWFDGGLGADFLARGFHACLFTLTGKRGGTVICMRSIRSGEFSAI